MRPMAKVAQIDEVRDIPDADAISAYRVGGWWVVDRKNAYQVNDLVIYCEVDSWIPHSLAPFLSKGGDPKEFNGVSGNRLRTIRLRKQISQGLILSIDALTGLTDNVFLGQDVSELFGIQKWEAPIPAQLAGEVRGVFPSFGKKTDQERIQSLSSEFNIWKEQGLQWEVSTKLDGSSMSVYFYNGDFGVCSRNLNLKESDKNTFWQVARKLNLEEKLRKFGKNIMIQSELCGPGIQGNKEKLIEATLFCFDIFDIDKQSYLSASERMSIIDLFELPSVPSEGIIMLSEFASIDNVLEYAKGKSLNAEIREGVVFKCIQNPNLSFKAINNDWLIRFE